jgi:hypothetical protein
VVETESEGDGLDPVEKRAGVQLVSGGDPPALVVIAPAWPGISSGYGLAIYSSLVLYARLFDQIHFICVSDEARPRLDAPELSGVTWSHVEIRKTPVLWRFLRSISSAFPAITMRYLAARPRVLTEFRNYLGVTSGPVRVIFEDLPTACFLQELKKAYPECVWGIRSHNALLKAYEGLTRVGNVFSRLAWWYELRRIEAYERQACEQVDFLWTITSDDAREYRDRFHVEADGVIGVFLDVSRYSAVPKGGAHTVVSIGTADLRKGSGLESFIGNCWPKVRRRFPDARLVLAGRGTARFSDSKLGVEGRGFVEDDRDILNEGQVFVNPQTIGSGIQLKSVVAMISGKLLVSSILGAEGIVGVDGEHFLVSDSEECMAAQIVSVMEDQDKSDAISRRGRSLAVEFYEKQSFLRRSTDSMIQFAASGKSDI